MPAHHACVLSLATIAGGQKAFSPRPCGWRTRQHQPLYRTELQVRVGGLAASTTIPPPAKGAASQHAARKHTNGCPAPTRISIRSVEAQNLIRLGFWSQLACWSPDASIRPPVTGPFSRHNLAVPSFEPVAMRSPSQLQTTLARTQKTRVKALFEELRGKGSGARMSRVLLLSCSPGHIVSMAPKHSHQRWLGG